MAVKYTPTICCIAPGGEKNRASILREILSFHGVAVEDFMLLGYFCASQDELCPTFLYAVIVPMKHSLECPVISGTIVHLPGTLSNKRIIQL